MQKPGTHVPAIQPRLDEDLTSKRDPFFSLETKEAHNIKDQSD
jgi:hypothetical protein